MYFGHHKPFPTVHRQIQRITEAETVEKKDKEAKTTKRESERELVFDDETALQTNHHFYAGF